MKRTQSRAGAGALLILAAVAASSCDSRRTIDPGGGGDAGIPRIFIDVPSARNDSVLVSQKLAFTIRATDNLSLLTVFDSVYVSGVLMGSDSVRFTSATPAYNKQREVSAVGIRDNEQVRIVAYALDGSGNWNFAFRTLTVYDTLAPKVVVTAPAADKTIRPGGIDSIKVSATDSSGLSRIGFELHTDSVITAGSVPSAQSSVAIANTPVTAVRAFPADFNLPPGKYFIRGFADDISSQRGYSSVVRVFLADTAPPMLDLQRPPDGSNILVTDTVIAQAHMSDAGGLANLFIVGVAIRGNPDLGATDTVRLYDTVYVPVKVNRSVTSLPPGVTDTLVQRLMLPVSGIASIPDTLVYFIGQAADRAGNIRRVENRVRRVSGPSLVIEQPAYGDSVSPGQIITVQVRASDSDGVSTVGYTFTGSNFIRTRADTLSAPLPTTHTFTDTITVPSDAVIGDSLTISPFGTDAGNRSGAGTFVRVLVSTTVADAVSPRVYQTVPSRMQSTHSLSIRAEDNSGVARVGYYLFHVPSGALITSRDSVLSAPYVSGITVEMPVIVPSIYAGGQAYAISYAEDALANRGWSIRSGTTLPQADSTLAKRDTVLLAFGTTSPYPTNSKMADLAVNANTGQVFLANMAANRVNIWRASDSTFFSSIAVGSEPWGLAVDVTGDTLFVANSGGTNFSVVSFTSLREERRIRTPNTVVADVSAQFREGVWRYTAVIIDYSDRPQNIGVSANGNIFFSTKPTSTAPAGTIRFYDMQRREVQQIWQYGAAAAPGKIMVLNIDGIAVFPSFNPDVSDQIRICGHEYGNPGVTRCRQGDNIYAVVDSLRTIDLVAAVLATVTPESLVLTDTTFVAEGGDKRWIAFGEAHTGSRAGRIMLAKDEAGSQVDDLFFSPGISVTDLTNNASEKVFGLALNSNSSSLAAHGNLTYFADVDELAFHQRLQGTVASGPGAGIAFHPDNNGAQSDTHGVAFIATGNSSILVADSWNFYVRREIPIAASITGALVASRPFPGDPADVVVKLFGMTSSGLVVIDLRQSDISP